MASSSLFNFLSFFTQSKPPQPAPPKLPPSHLPLYSDSTSSSPPPPSRNRDRSPPLVASNEGYDHPLSPPSDIVSVVCPSLAFANTLFFRSAYNVQVIVDDNEPEEKLLNRFRREVMKAGVIQECKRRRFFENKQDEKKRRSRDAAKRNRRRRGQWGGSSQDKQEASKDKKVEGDEDNWELPEGGLPY
ncbi:hypothetical protein U1Q18_012576 [Sarracenia purpurea var. burkii]